ncbi:MAG: DUF4340 domain-containing protein [Pseudomonadota bacterium]
MSGIDRARRRMLLGIAGLGAVSALGLAVQALSASSTPKAADQAGLPVFPDFLSEKANVRNIRVLTRGTVYTLQYEADQWKLLESGGYPVREDRLAALSAGLETLSWGELRTRDPGKFDRIGLGHPEENGQGALIEIYTKGGEKIGSLITGRKASRLYGRRADDPQCWTLDGDLPPLYARQAWLDLDVIDMQPEVISGVNLKDASGRTLNLRRQLGDTVRDFIPSGLDSDLELRNQLVASAPALALSRLSPIDVKSASALQTEPLYEHVTVTFDALEIKLKAYAEPDGYFVTLRAIEAGNGAELAASVNGKAADWAFQLEPFDWNDFTVPVADLVRP